MPETLDMNGEEKEGEDILENKNRWYDKIYTYAKDFFEVTPDTEI